MRNEIVENCLYMIGEARDFLDREERDLLGLVDKLDEGKITPIAARLKIALDFSAAHKDLHDYELMLAESAKEADFPYLHPALREKSVPLFRIVKEVPEGIA